MSEKVKLIMQAGPQRTEDGRPTFDLRFIPNEESRAQIEGRHMPEIRMQVYRTEPNAYTERYIVEGLLIANVEDKFAGAPLLAVCAVVAANVLNAGRDKFVEQGFTHDVLSTIEGLENYTYEAPTEAGTRLVSVTGLPTHMHALNAIGFDVELPEALQAKAESVFDLRQRHLGSHVYEACMEQTRTSVAETNYSLRIAKSVADREADVLVLADFTARTINIDNVDYTLAVLDTATVGYDIEPWSKTELVMLAASAFNGLGMKEGKPLILAVSKAVTEEYDSLAQLSIPQEDELFQGTYVLPPPTVQEFMDNMTDKGMLIRVVRPGGDTQAGGGDRAFTMH